VGVLGVVPLVVIGLAMIDARDPGVHHVSPGESVDGMCFHSQFRYVGAAPLQPSHDLWLAAGARLVGPDDSCQYMPSRSVTTVRPAR
jgi:hypothetical protein